ncbi:MAG: fibronectin type III domain-containing protein, partial [Actinomycetales bacterium]
MSLRTLFRRTAVPVAAAVILGAVAAVPAEAAVGTVAKPTLYQATVASPGIKVSWKAVSRATSYQVQYSTSSAFRGAVTQSPGKVTSYVVKGLTPKKKYYFRVRAKTTASVGRWSLAVAKTRQTNKLLGTPTGYAVVGDGADLIVKWVRPKSSNTDTPISYRLALGDYRQVDDKILTDPEDGRTRYYRSGSLRTSSAAPKLRVKGAPALTLNGFGRAVYVQILSQNSDGSWKSDGGKAATRTAFGVVPADPDTTAGITATAGCTNVVVRWNKGIPANATGLDEVGAAGLEPRDVDRLGHRVPADGRHERADGVVDAGLEAGGVRRDALVPADDHVGATGRRRDAGGR